MQGKGARAIRRFCLECQGQSSISVQTCSDSACPLHAARLCTVQPANDPHLALLRLVRRYCFVCAGSRQAIRGCQAKETCHLWSYRFGVLPSTYKRVAQRIRKQQEHPLLPGVKAVKKS